jgi:siroheme synthase (precorrin-2 oxidase/ferrochelatase)
VLTVAEILAEIEKLPTREQQELSQVVLNLPINKQIEDRVDRSLPDDSQASRFWEKVERFRALLQTAEIDVNEIWEDVRDRSPGREVDLW